MSAGPRLDPCLDDAPSSGTACGTIDMSVVICTAGRPAALARMLASLATADAPRCSWEVLVVDNLPAHGQVDAVVAAHGRRLPLRVAAEPRAGLARARNRAIGEARGRYIVFADDDVTVDAGWLQAYEAAFEDSPEVAVFGGPIVPVFERASPRWVEAVRRHAPSSYAWLEADASVALSPLGEGGIQPFGANFALRLDALSRAPFDVAWGRQPNRPRLLGYEEVLLVDALLRDGARGRWLPEARVLHHMPRSRCTRRYLDDYWYAVGWAEGVLTARGRTVGAPADANLLQQSARRRRRRWRKVRWWAGPQQWVPALRDAARARGRCDGFAEAEAGTA
ncbi:MAG: glycosyltransferase family A protein [Planctomycetota bacterium]